MDLPARFEALDHPAWATGLATVAGYLLLLLGVFLVLFVLPWLVLSGL